MIDNDAPRNFGKGRWQQDSQSRKYESHLSCDLLDDCITEVW